MTPELYQECERAIHVLTTEGRTLRAGRATLFILEGLGWGVLARLLCLPPFIWGIELGYRLVANNRHFFARFLFIKEPNTDTDREPPQS